MKGLHELENENFIAIAKLIDNNFIGNKKIVVGAMRKSIVYVTGHTEGGQCINCQIKIDIQYNKLNGVFTQNEDTESPGAFRHVMPPTLKKVIDYLKANNFEYCPPTNSRVVA